MLYHVFHCKEERRLPDLLYVSILTIISVIAFITHLPSLYYIVRHFRRPNNANLIYRNLFLVDLIFLIIFDDLVSMNTP